MRYLYTLTSSPQDYYYEQFLLSATSLIQIMPNAEIVLLCDSKTKETLSGKRGEYEKIVSNTVAENTPKGYSQVEVSRWIKTSMRRLIQGDFLFIDCDTIITGDLSSITELNTYMSACLDCHSFLDKHFNRETFISSDKKLGFNSYLTNRHYNSGVIYCKDTPEIHKIFNRWHELWLFSRSKNILRDQPSFNMAICENTTNFSELDGIWNCQIPFNSVKFLSESKIIHYFASTKSYTSPFIPAASEIFSKIKNKGVITDDIKKLLDKPRSAFISNSRIISGEDMLHLINSDVFKFIYILDKKSPSLFKFINNICTLLKKLLKKRLVKYGAIQ